MTSTFFYTIVAVLSVASRGNDPGAQEASTVSISRLGYRTDDEKIAFARKYGDGTFEIVDANTGRKVYSGPVHPIGIRDAASGDTLYPIEFTAVDSPGQYRILLPLSGHRSPPFRIGDDVFASGCRAGIQSFYYQRCGINVSNGTVWRHEACHLRNAVLLDDPGTTLDTRGGWHDAGDYNKFVPTTAVSAAMLMSLFEWDPDRWSDGDLNIPESDNGIPDILDEVRWGLAWLLKMQREDGGVYHKVSIKRWTGEHLPERETDTQFVFDVSSTSTAGLAAVTAQGARLFSKWDAGFSSSLLRASVLAWDFLQKHPAIVPPGGFRNPPGVEGGEYGDTDDSDERLWAATELYRTTGHRAYHEEFLKNAKRLGGIGGAISWQRVHNLAYYAYLGSSSESVDLAMRAFIIASLTAHTDRLLQRIGSSGYRYILTPEEFYWGSNSVAMGYAIDLLYAARVTGNDRYIQGAADQLAYMAGRNPWDKTLVTGLGTGSVQRPYHQYSMLLHWNNPVPGMMVGGPNKGSRLQGKQLSPFPGKSYEDNQKNYFVNETAINYTAPFVFVSGILSMGETSGASARNIRQGGDAR